MYRGISNCHFHVWFYVQVADPKPVEMNTMYYIFSKCTSLFHPTNLQIFMCHTFCATLCHLFCCATLYIVNVPHFCLMCYMFQTICPMFYPLSITFPIEYKVLCKNNCATLLCHTVAHIFCATLYIVNVPHFSVMCHTFI